MKTLLFALIALVSFSVYAIDDQISVTLNGKDYVCSGAAPSSNIICACEFVDDGRDPNDSSKVLGCRVELQIFNKSTAGISVFKQFATTGGIANCGKAPLAATETSALQACQRTLESHPFCN